MSRTWFVGAAGPGPPAHPGDLVAPLSSAAEGAAFINWRPEGALEQLEVQIGARVFRDLIDLAHALTSDERSKPWVEYRGRDLSSAFRRPDEAVGGFANQALAFHVANELVGRGPFEAWGVDPFQRAGVRAAVGDALGATAEKKGAPRRARPSESWDRLPSSRPSKCDILYLSLEPHVALQQDHVLSRLSAKHRIAPVSAHRRVWAWPPKAAFQPALHPSLSSFLRPEDLVSQAFEWSKRRAFKPRPERRAPWMDPSESSRWIRSTWLRSARVIDAVTRAIEHQRPRLLLGTNLASGMGTLISRVATDLGVGVLSLPSGADYLVAPSFDASDIGQTKFVTPGEGITSLLRAAGVSADQLFACGWPEMDALGMSGGEGGNQIRVALGVRDGQRLAIFFSSPSATADELVVSQESKCRAFEQMVVACRAEGLALTVKLHPREDDGAIRSIAESSSPRVPVFDDRLPDLLQAADVVASVGSAVSFAGVVLGKTTIILEATRIARTAALFASLGVGVQPRSLDELRAFLSQPSPLPTRRHPAFQGADSRVAERIEGVVEHLLR